MFVLVGLAGISFFYGGVVVGLSLVTAAKLAVTTKQHEEHDTKKKKRREYALRHLVSNRVPFKKQNFLGVWNLKLFFSFFFLACSGYE